MQVVLDIARVEDQGSHGIAALIEEAIGSVERYRAETVVYVAMILDQHDVLRCLSLTAVTDLHRLVGGLSWLDATANSEKPVIALIRALDRKLGRGQ